jgi:hypothetical protein
MGELKKKLEDYPVHNRMGYTLIQTCSACPEQYEVYKGVNEVGYLRLRHGFFRADYPYCGGEEVYTSDTEGDGIFEGHERDMHLDKAILAIDEKRKHDKH